MGVGPPELGAAEGTGRAGRAERGKFSRPRQVQEALRAEPEAMKPSRSRSLCPRSSHPITNRNNIDKQHWQSRLAPPPRCFVFGRPSFGASFGQRHSRQCIRRKVIGRELKCARSRMNGWPVIGRPSLALPLRCTVHAVRQAAKRVCGMRRSPRQAADRAAKRGRRDEGADAMLV